MRAAHDIIDIQLLQEICDQVAGEIDAIVTIIAEGGEIIASSRRSRIGDVHSRAARILAGEENAMAVTAEEAAGDPTILEGALLPIDIDGKRIFGVGVAAPLQIARPYARMIQLWVRALLRERALGESEQRFRDVAESAGDWIWEMDEDLRFTYVSPRFFEILRVTSDAVLGKTRGELAAAEFDSDAWREHETKLAARLPFRDFAYVARTSDGGSRHLKIHGKPIYDPKGTFMGYRGTGYDVTEQIEMKKTLDRSQRLLSEAIETIPEGFSLYDEEDRLVVFNSKYRAMLYPGADIRLEAGMSFEAIVRQAVEQGFVPEAEGRVETWIRQRLALRRDQSEPHIQKRGDDRWILVSEHRTGDGGMVALYSDITEIKQREQELADKTKAMERLSGQLAKYLSPQVYETIFTGRNEVKVTSQRKKLTIFFSDIVDFTAITDSLEPEELTNHLNHYLTEMSNIAHEYGATIDKYVGDGIVAFFGDPETRGVKEDATACVKMAIAMQQRMNELRSQWLDSGLEKPFRLRIGINTGYCTVGNFGSEDRMDYTLNGSEVNLAARLESHAEVGGILLAYETHTLVKDAVMTEEGNMLTVKGFVKPVQTFRVVGLYDELAAQEGVIHKKQDGVRVLVDLGNGNKETAIEVLEDVLSQLKS